MGELKPCPNPWCIAKTPPLPVQRRKEVASSWAVACGCGVKSPWAASHDEAITAWNTRPRTEGRGDGEPNEHLTKRSSKPLSAVDRVVMDEARGRERDTLFSASPIREPEISRTILGEPCTLEACPPGLFVSDAYNTLGMKSEYRTEQGAIEAYIVESGEFFWGDNPQTVERQRAQIVRPIGHADATLNLAPAGGRSQAMADVAAERQRQMEVEGWTPEHDDGHGGDLLTAAVCYAQRRMDEDRFGVFANYAPAAWPWGASWWKPKDRRRDLIRAAALLVAEIERIDRVPPPPQEQGG